MTSLSIDIEDLPYAIIASNSDGIITQCNQLAEALTGYDENELLNQAVEVLLADELVESHRKHRANYQQGSGALSNDRVIQVKTKQGTLITCSINVCETSDGFVTSIKEYSTLSSLHLPHSSVDVQKVMTNIDEAYWEWNIEKDVVHYSSKAMAILGYETKALTGPISVWNQLLSPEDVTEVYQKIQSHLNGDTSNVELQYQITTMDGDKKWVGVTGKVFHYDNGEPTNMFGSIKDITESHTMIEQLKNQNGYLRLAEKMSNAGHWHVDFVNNTLYWSEGIYAIHGLSQDNYKPELKSAIELYDENEQEKVEKSIADAIERKSGFHYKSVIRHALGKKIKVESLGEVELDENGNVIGLFGVFRDISKSEETFEKLKLLAMVNYTITVPIFFIDDKDNIVYQDLSPQMGNQNAVLFNYINFSIKDYLHYKRIAKEKGQIKEAGISFDKYNSVFDLSVTYESDEGIYIWIVENITDKFRKEQQQFISNRLALLGNTFGNVSHDINNVLGVALGATEMLEMKVAQGEINITKYIERVKNAIDKGKTVTERLLAFTRKPTVKVVDFDPMEEIEANLYLFKQLLLSTIEFTFEKDQSKSLVTFPQGEFINILLNIVLNAQDAIREHGMVGKIEMSANVSGNDRLEVRVRDSGIGISQENLSKIFDPFYSSKSVNKGNGIGLANVYSTMYKHNGEIQVAGYSELGGAEFTLIFKCRKISDSSQVKEVKSPKMGLTDKSVLILDDEISIAEFVALFLNSEGAQTNHVTSKEALENVLSQNHHYDVFITDMIMPDISGREAVELVLSRYPNINVLSMSGYIAEEDTAWHYPVLRKPFNSKELASFIKNND